MILHRFFLLFLLFVSVSSSAQPAGRFRVRHYSTEEGLPSNGIKGLEWDGKNGFLWIGTEAGVARFNGSDFRIFSRQNLPELNPDRISNMMRDRNGAVFVFNQYGNLFGVENNRLAAVRQEAIPGGFSASGLSLEERRYVQQEALKAGLKQLPRLFASGNSWIVSGMGNVYRISRDSSTGPELLHTAVKQLFEASSRLFVLKSDNTLQLAEGNDGSSSVPLRTEAGKPLQINSSSGLLWQYGMRCPVLVTGQQAWLLEYTGGAMRAREIGDAVPAGSLLRFAQYDEKGKTLFIGTESKGVIVVTENRVQPVKNRRTGINERTAYYSQVKLNDSTVLTNEGHVLSTSAAAVAPVKGPFSFRVSAAGDTAVWYVKMVNGTAMLCRHHLKTGVLQFYRGRGLLPAVSVAEYVGRVYVAGISGIAVLGKDSLEYICRYPQPLPGTHEPFDMLAEPGGALVFANCSALLRFDLRSHRTDTLFQLKDYCIRTLRKYGDYLLLGTYGGGYYIYRNGVCRLMPTDKNKFLLYTHCFMPDAAGFCWMSTNRGLFKAKMQDMLDAFEGKQKTVYYHYLGRNDGMDITEMNGGCTPCALQLNERTLSFPMMDGLLWVRPLDEQLVLPEGGLFIDEMKVNGIVVGSDSAVQHNLPAGAGEIEVRLGFPAWCGNENIYLDYRLDESEAWKPVEITTAPLIKLSNLPPGSYRLQIRRMNGFGADNYSYKTIGFSIAAPWHKRWWFYLLLTACATGLFMLIYRVRTRRLINNQLKLERQVAEKTKELQQKNMALEKNNSLNTRLISIISHDIVTPLKFLHVAGKNLIEKKNLMTEDLKDETIREITSTSSELQLLSTNILNWIKYQTENRRLVKEQFVLHELVNQSLSVLYSLARRKQVTIENRIPEDLAVWQYFEPLKILVYNLVTNAINFSEKGSIVIRCVTAGRQLTLTVQDEGAGMTEEQISNIMEEQIIVSSANKDNRKGHGLGYLIIKDLLKTMGASLAIQSEKGRGTAVSVTMPCGQETPQAD